MRCVGRSWERREGRGNVVLVEFRRLRERVFVAITNPFLKLILPCILHYAFTTRAFLSLAHSDNIHRRLTASVLSLPDEQERQRAGGQHRPLRARYERHGRSSGPRECIPAALCQPGESCASYTIIDTALGS